ncbi:Hydrolase (fragment) [Parafrankia sp. Ea1.12]
MLADRHVDELSGAQAQRRHVGNPGRRLRRRPHRNRLRAPRRRRPPRRNTRGQTRPAHSRWAALTPRAWGMAEGLPTGGAPAAA